MLKLVSGLQDSSIRLPDASARTDAACDETISGAGRWRLCLQEHTKLSADEIRSRQTRKSMLRPVRPSTREKRRDNGAQKQSMDVVRHLCGSDCAAMLATSGRI